MLNEVHSQNKLAFSSAEEASLLKDFEESNEMLTA